MKEVQNERSIAIDFAKSYIHTSNQAVRDILLDAMAETLNVPMPSIEGKSIGVSIDISGSMLGEPLQTAGLMAVPFLKAKNLWLTTFDTCIYEQGVIRSWSRLNPFRTDQVLCPNVNKMEPRQQVEALLNLHINGGTDCAISIREAISKEKHLDIHVLITDEQQNAGSSPVREAWREYKAKFIPNAQLWIVNASNTVWTSADYGDPSVIAYQSMTPALFNNLEFAGENLISEINNFDLKSNYFSIKGAGAFAFI
jgi:hypothetical protein